MSEDCPFCGIIAGEIPSYTVYEDEDVMAFLDVNPLARGHTLVVPKKHHPRVSGIPAEATDAVFQTAGRLSGQVATAVDADGTTIAVNDGPAAGQEVPHVHVHIVPRFDGDDGGAIHSVFQSQASVSDEELQSVAEDIKDGD